MMKEPILQMGTSFPLALFSRKYRSLSLPFRSVRHFTAFHKPYRVRFPNRSKWERDSTSIKKGGLIRSKTNDGDGVCGHGMKQKFSFGLGQCTTVIQAEVYAIKEY
jgi:hypothetical protein